MSDYWSTDLAGAAHYADGSGLPEGRMTRAEAEADEYGGYDPLASTVRCPRGCPSRFHGYYTEAALRHAAEAHGLVVEPPEEHRGPTWWGWTWDRAKFEAMAAAARARGAA